MYKASKNMQLNNKDRGNKISNRHKHNSLPLDLKLISVMLKRQAEISQLFQSGCSGTVHLLFMFIFHLFYHLSSYSVPLFVFFRIFTKSLCVFSPSRKKNLS